MKDSLDILYKWFTWSGESKTSFDMKAAMDKAISAVEQFHSWMNITLIQKMNLILSLRVNISLTQ